MVSITLAVPRDLKKEMEQHPEMNWSEIARQAIIARLGILKEMDKVLAKSKLTEKNALQIGRIINKSVAKKLKEMM
jgi:hypothetical protein